MNFMQYDIFNEDGLVVERGPQENRFPFDVMEVGDYFELPLHMRDDVRSAQSWYSKRTNQKFQTLTFRSELIARCQRIA